MILIFYFVDIREDFIALKVTIFAFGHVKDVFPKRDAFGDVCRFYVRERSLMRVKICDWAELLSALRESRWLHNLKIFYSFRFDSLYIRCLINDSFPDSGQGCLVYAERKTSLPTGNEGRFDVIHGVESPQVNFTLSDRLDADLIVNFVRIALPDARTKIRFSFVLSETSDRQWFCINTGWKELV